MDLMSTKFGTVLTRSNKNIRDDRALNIAEDAELSYKRKVENLEKDLKVLFRQRIGMLDLSPGNTYSLKLESFDPEMFVEKHTNLGLEIRNLEIKLEVAKAGYAELFSAAMDQEILHMLTL